jgi:hypothetical protein
MRFVLLALSAIAATTVFNTPTKAQNYPWCAYYSGKEGGGTNCGFTTFQQCLDTVSGIGGSCQRNNLYQPPPGPHPYTRQRRYPY